MKFTDVGVILASPSTGITLTMMSISQTPGSQPTPVDPAEFEKYFTTIADRTA